jgi:hypothetical protein
MDMTSHIVIIKLLIAYTCVGVFVFTAIVGCLSLVKLIDINKQLQRKLFALLITEVVVVSVATFASLLEFNPKTAIKKIEYPLKQDNTKLKNDVLALTETNRQLLAQTTASQKLIASLQGEGHNVTDGNGDASGLAARLQLSENTVSMLKSQIALIQQDNSNLAAQYLNAMKQIGRATSVGHSNAIHKDDVFSEFTTIPSPKPLLTPIPIFPPSMSPIPTLPPQTPWPTIPSAPTVSPTPDYAAPVLESTSESAPQPEAKPN